MTAEKQRKTFLSYSRNNKDFAIKLAKELKSEGFAIWLDQMDIPLGSRWDDEVEKALEECEIFMVILTPSSSMSDNVKDEIGYAIDTRKRILPVLLENATIPLRLRRLQYVDFTSKSFDEGVESAKELLRGLINQPTMPRVELSGEQREQLSQGEAVRAAKANVEEKSKVQEEADRLAMQKAEEERSSREKAEIDRRIKEEAERLFVQRTEEDRLAKAKAAEELAAKAKVDREAKAEIERRAKVEAERLATQKAEANRVAKQEVDAQKRVKASEPRVVPMGTERTSENIPFRNRLNAWMQVWWKRGLIVTIVMTVLGFVAVYLETGYMSGASILIVISIIVGLFGFMFYPHKISYILTAVFGVIGTFIWSPAVYSIYTGLWFGLGSGFILTAIISRILHAIKKI
jgi:hypothetical protein